MRTPEKERAAYVGLTPAKVAARIPCSTGHVRNLIRLGAPKGLEAIDVSLGDVPRYVVMPEELTRWKHARKVKGRAAA